MDFLVAVGAIIVWITKPR